MSWHLREQGFLVNSIEQGFVVNSIFTKAAFVEVKNRSPSHCFRLSEVVKTPRRWSRFSLCSWNTRYDIHAIFHKTTFCRLCFLGMSSLNKYKTVLHMQKDRKDLIFLTLTAKHILWSIKIYHRCLHLIFVLAGRVEIFTYCFWNRCHSSSSWCFVCWIPI